MLHWVTELFTPNVSYTMPVQLKPFNYTNSPPQVKISTIVLGSFYLVSAMSSGLIRLWKDPFVGTGGVLLEHAEEPLAKGSEH